MVLVFSGMLAGIGAFMIVFFPRGMAAQAERSTKARAVSIVEVMATAVGPSIEFEDAEHAASILAWLETTHDARFAWLQRGDGVRFAAWHPERAPKDMSWPAAANLRSDGDLLVTSIPVRGEGGAMGMLHVGFSLDDLHRERVQLQKTVAIVAIVVVLIGVFATLVAVRFIVRPIRRLTATARKIAAGSSPAELPELAGPDEIAELATALRAMVERLNELSQQELMRASRHAGMAEVATGVLHNVGNILNSVNVTVELLREGDRSMSVQRLTQLKSILEKLDPKTLDATKVAALVKFTDVLATSLAGERAATIEKIDTLRGHVDHIKRVVSMQNAYARQTSVIEVARVRGLVEEAVEIALPPARRAALTLEIDVPDAHAKFDRHRALQIVVNLIANARDAVATTDGPKQVAISGTMENGKLTISVRDSGIGFTPETGQKLFAAGFTTKQQGHGYGLHSSALAARQLGGELRAKSDGLGRGATFSLVLPLLEAS
jgi:signal transduction histidine kinase